MTIKRIETSHRFSEAVVHNNTVYLAGQVPFDDTADAYGQTQQVLAEIDKWLAQAGSDKTRLLSATVYLKDMQDYAEMNRAWDEWLPEGKAPARAAVEAKLANPNWKVEIVVVAACF